ncbi:MAG: serine/threonine protein kinase, partial [Myxococcales bacterium]|nr:serine/threonine protein kinase [Myxococcales bacterium]
MDHPAVADILAHAAGRIDGAIEAHLVACATCRAIAGLGAPFGDRGPPLIEVDPGLYTDRVPLADHRGGMGHLLRARDRRLGREVVIKQARALPGSGDALRARFLREARLTARLQHPSIVGVLELGRWPDDEPFYTMPLVEGTPLDDAIAAATVPEARLLLLPRLVAAAEAIAYAHGRGVLHRDIKPANILLGSFGETVVIDWGLARTIDGADGPEVEGPAPADGLTRFGAGTAAYMPPEQARGGATDPRVDVYALGATLYHLLAGVAPYGAGDGDTIRRRVLAGPPAPLA